MVEATRAIYLDFENIPHEAPSLLGWVCEGHWTIAILEEDLEAALAWDVPRGSVISSSADTVLEEIRLIA